MSLSNPVGTKVDARKHESRDTLAASRLLPWSSILSVCRVWTPEPHGSWTSCERLLHKNGVLWTDSCPQSAPMVAVWSQSNEKARRRIIHSNVTAYLTAKWSAQQLRNAFCDQEPPRLLIRDRDTKFGEVFTQVVSALGVEPLLTTYRSPWQNGYCERLIGSIRRECLDHGIILNETHLRGILQEYVHYYNTQRTHLGIGKDSPEPREVQAYGEIDKVAVVNGLHHFYYRRAA